MPDGVRVLVKTSDRGDQVSSYLSNHGGKVNSRHGSIVSVTLPYNALSGLAKLNSVSFIEASKRLDLQNDLAASDDVGTKLASILETNPNYNGNGVWVGVIDTGIDTTLDAFKDEEGKSRISYFWNMSENDKTRYPTVVTPEGESRTYSYGSEYTAADIDSQNEDSPIFNDTGAHGTHVSGTIGGRDTLYPGMAPAVKYVVVSDGTSDEADSADMWTGAGSGTTLDALEYILSRANEAGVPLVVNMSQGTLLGPHDGSTLFEQAIQSDIEERNLIFCVSAGNDQDSAKNAEITIPAGGSEELTLFGDIYPEIYDDVLYSAIDIWSTGNPKLDITLIGNGTERTIAYGESIDTYEDFGSGIKVACATELNSPLNGDDHYLINFHGSAFMSLRIRFTNNGTEDAKVNAYLQRNTDSYFEDHVGGGTLGLPSTTPGVITVGCYSSRVEWQNKDGKIYSNDNDLGQITSFSGTGPVRKPDLYKGVNAVKPDIVAPGSMLISQMSTGSEMGEAYIIDDLHAAMQGTSMSAPVVTGTVALILQNMPDATAEQIKEILFDMAYTDDFTGEVPNVVYGHGKLNANSVESSKIVSPKPSIAEITRSKTEATDLIVTGVNFTPAIDVYVNGLMWDPSLVTFQDNGTLILHNVFGKASPLSENGDVEVKSVKVVNRLGKDGANSSELTVNEKESSTIDNLKAGSGGCFIATAAYGSYLEPEVMTLRRFRDRSLITNAPGRMFVKLYYTYSPPVADFIAAHPSARFATRVALTPIVYSVGHPGIAMMLVLAFGAAGATLYRRRRSDEKAS
ncbi:S8 family serine peptidase [bacterium]|nr:S8 family serine peptidase [bacterium]